jgi:hypothetical protein
MGIAITDRALSLRCQPSRREKSMPNELIIIAVVLLLGSWFLLGESKSFLEKLAIVFAILFTYVAYRLMSGASVQDIISPLMK